MNLMELCAKIWALLSGNDSAKRAAIFQKAIDEGTEAVSKVTQTVWDILSFVGNTTVNFTSRPNETTGSFFTTKSGLWVSDNFRIFFKDLLDQPLPSISQILSYYNLTKSANDFEIEGEFQKNNTPFIFENPLHFLAFLAGLILTQWGGKPGALLSDDYKPNLFYVRVNGGVVVVHVYWRAVERKWDVRAYSRDDARWNAGYRLFRIYSRQP